MSSELTTVTAKKQPWLRLCDCFDTRDQSALDSPARVLKRANLQTIDLATSSKQNKANQTSVISTFPESFAVHDVVISSHSSKQGLLDAPNSASQEQGQGTKFVDTASSIKIRGLAQEAIEKIKKSAKSKEILLIMEEFARNSEKDTSETERGITFKELLDGMQKLGDQNTERNGSGDEGERSVWDKLKIGERVSKTVKILSQFVSVGDVVASFDPVHAALPWAAVRFVLVVLTATKKVDSLVVACFTEVTSLVFQCETYERFYIPTSTTTIDQSAVSNLKEAVISSYYESILFLASVVQHHRQWCITRVAAAPFKLGDIEDHLDRLNGCAASLSLHSRICETDYSHQSFNGLEASLRNAAKSLDQQSEDMRKIFQTVGDILPVAKRVDEKIDDIRALNHIDLLSRVVTHDACYDADLNGCLESTRVAVLDQIDTWATKPDSKTIFWLKGMAGTGKTTVSRSVCQKLAEKQLLGGSFFFKRGHGSLGSYDSFFVTIAYQLAKSKPSTASYIHEAIAENSEIIHKHQGMKKQFEELIRKPLHNSYSTHENIQTMVIVVDALDECIDNEGKMSEMLRLFTTTKIEEGILLKFFVTGRPESRIQTIFEGIRNDIQVLALESVSRDVVARDIKLFFEHELGRIQKPAVDWPGNIRVDQLVEIANGLFIFATTVCLFIQDDVLGDPESNLKSVLRPRTNFQGSRLDPTYTPVLEQLLYQRTGQGMALRSNTEQEKIAQNFLEVVGLIVLLATPLSTNSLAAILGKPLSRDGFPLKFLHPVLDIPEDDDTPIKLIHLSFRDFLVDKEKNGKSSFWVDEKKHHQRLAERCLSAMLKSDYLRKDICNLKKPGTMRADISRARVEEHLPKHIQYACLYWVST